METVFHLILCLSRQSSKLGAISTTWIHFSAFSRGTVQVRMSDHSIVTALVLRHLCNRKLGFREGIEFMSLDVTLVNHILEVGQPLSYNRDSPLLLNCHRHYGASTSKLSWLRL